MLMTLHPTQNPLQKLFSLCLPVLPIMNNFYSLKLWPSWTFTWKPASAGHTGIPRYDGWIWIGLRLAKLPGISRHIHGLLPPKYTLLRRLGVVPEHRQQGLGKQITQRYLDWVDEQPCNHVLMRISDTPSLVNQMFIDMGFEDIGVSMELPLVEWTVPSKGPKTILVQTHSDCLTSTVHDHNRVAAKLSDY